MPSVKDAPVRVMVEVPVLRSSRNSYSPGAKEPPAGGSNMISVMRRDCWSGVGVAGVLMVATRRSSVRLAGSRGSQSSMISPRAEMVPLKLPWTKSP